MVLTGKQKAAMLLMSLDAGTAAELLKGVDSDMVQELALELAYLDASGYRNNKTSADFARDFCNSLRSGESFHLKSFLDEMLRNTVGNEKAQRIQKEITDLLQKRDPFIRIRAADARQLAMVLESEHPQAVGVVLGELDAKKSSEVLGTLNEGVRLSVINRMTSREQVSPEAKGRIAEMVNERLRSASGAGTTTEGQGQQSLRKVAVILRNLGKELRDGLIGAIKEKDSEAAEKVAELMIVWQDVPQVTDRSLQQALRGIEAQRLALALHNAEDLIKEKIRSNISERAAAMMDEEASLMSALKKEDIAGAQDEIVKILREMNQKGELAFVE